MEIISTIEEKIFAMYGKIEFLPKLNSKKIILNFFENENLEEKLEEYIDDIINEKNEKNLLLLKNLIYYLIDEDVAKFNKILIKIFLKMTQSIKIKIIENIKNKKMTLPVYIQIYNQYQEKCQILYEYLRIYQEYIRRESKFSYISLIKNYIYYQEIQVNKFKTENGEEYIHEIILGSGSNNVLYQETKHNMSLMTSERKIEDVFNLMKMYIFYRKLRLSGKEKNDTNAEEMERKFMTMIANDMGIIKEINQKIDNTLKNLKKNKYRKEESSFHKNKNGFEDEKNTSIKTIENIIDYISQTNEENVLFNIIYEEMLENRLLNDETNMEIEKNISNKLNNKGKLKENIINKLSDRKMSNEYLERKADICINIVTSELKERYGEKIKEIKNKIYPNFYKKEAWKISRKREFKNIQVNIDMKIYIELINNYFNVVYQHKKINWLFEEGEGILSMNLGNEKYNLRVTTMQMILILYFNDQTKITANELSKKMNLELTLLNKIINSFLVVEILILETEDYTNPDIPLMINKNFSNEIKEIDMIQILQDLEISQMEIDEQKMEIINEYEYSLERKIEAKIINTLKREKKMLISELENIINEYLTLIQEKLFFEKNKEKIYEKCIQEKYFKRNRKEVAMDAAQKISCVYEYEYLDEIEEDDIDV